MTTPERPPITIPELREWYIAHVIATPSQYDSTTRSFALELRDTRAALAERDQRIKELERELESCCERERARWEAEKELRARIEELERYMSEVKESWPAVNDNYSRMVGLARAALKDSE